MLDFFQAEFVADGKGDKAQRHIGNETHIFNKFKGLEANAGDAQSAQRQRADQQTCNQVAGNVGKIEFFGQSGQHQSGKHGNADGKQILHNDTSNSSKITVEHRVTHALSVVIIPFSPLDATRESYKNCRLYRTKIVAFL